MSNKIRVAIVGCGNIARRAHVPAWLANSQVEITALCDPSKESKQQILDRFKLSCPTFNTLDELLVQAKPDVVDLCTPGFLHYTQATQALQAGCHVLVEKPPVPSLAAAQELNALAERQGLKLGATFNYRYRDLVIQLKQLASRGDLGKLQKTYITHHGPFIYGDAPWLWDEKRSKYLLWEFGIHFIDILVYLHGPHKRILSVLPFEQESINHTTDLEISIEFEDGCIGRLEITADTTRHSSFFTHINVYGSAADAFVRWFPASIQVVSGQVNPLGLIWNEIKSTWQIGSMILRGQFLKHRNISHYRLINDYVDWISDKADFQLKFSAILPTLQLLEEIEAQVPTYQAEKNVQAESIKYV
jgi:predicted dehydrogenase